MPSNPFEGLDPDTMLRELRQQAADLESKATQLRTELAKATATATSPDGAVTVTLSPTGALQGITFTAKATAVKPEALGPLVMHTVAKAQQAVSKQVTESLSRQFGDSDTMDFVTQFMPTPAEPEKKAPRDPEEGTLLRKRQGPT